MPTQRAVSASTLQDLLFEKAEDGLCLVAPDGTVLRANAKWLGVTGLTLDDVLGEDLVALFPATRDMVLAMHARARAGHHIEVPRHVQKIEGRETWCEGSIDPIPMEGGTGLLLTLRPACEGPPPLEGADALPPDDAMLRAILNATRESVWLFSADGVALAANEAAVARWRKPREQLIGRRVTEYTPGPLGEARLARLRTVVQSGQPTEFEDERDGTRFEHTLYPVFGRGGVEWVAVFSRDLTRRLEERGRAEDALREGEERLRLAQAAGRIGTFEWNVKTGASTWSPELEAMYGLAPGAFQRTQRAWEDMLHPDDRARAVQELARACEDGVGAYDSQFRARRVDGAVRWFRSRGVEVRDAGGGRRMVGFVQDITDQKEAEQQLMDVNERLREADRRKNEFLGMLSHELRNPLAPIRNSAYILRVAPPGSEKARHAVEVIDRQAAHLARIVDDLLDVTRIARGKIELRRSRLDLREVVSRAAEDHRLALEDGGIALQIEMPAEDVWADVDATRVTQVVGNLLHNAAKFTRRGDEIRVRLASAEGAAEIRVRDTGAGIEAQVLPHLFEPFVQGARGLARTEGGLGLGLALVKGVVELHGGTVRAESGGVGLGAEFVVRLPLAEPREASRAGVGELPLGAGGRRVLVVDDNADAAESLADLLRLGGHQVDVAYDGPTAMAKLGEGAPEVILCDIGLPGMTGYDVAQEVRAAGHRVRLIAVSGYAQPEDVRRALEAGFDAHVSKPPDLDELSRLLI